MSTNRQETLFGPDAIVNPNDDLQPWRDHMHSLEVAAELDGTPRSNLMERRARMLEAIDTLALISRQTGLRKIATDPEKKDVLDERSTHYPDGVFKERVVPGARQNRKTAIDDGERMINEVIGDLEGAKKIAWDDLTSDERVELELDPEHGMEREELRINYRNKYGGRRGDKARKDYRRLAAGKKPKRQAA